MNFPALLKMLRRPVSVCNIFLADPESILSIDNLKAMAKSSSFNMDKYFHKNIPGQNEWINIRIIRNKSISKTLEKIMKDRKTVVEHEPHVIELIEDNPEKYSYVICPVIMNGDAIGLVLIVSVQSVGQVEEKMADVVSKFLGKHIEE